MVEQLEKEGPGGRNKEIARQLDAVGWGAFFVWIGIVLLNDLGAGLTLTVIGLITLGVQVARLTLGLRVEGFWVVVGSCFLLGGVGQLVETQIPLVPVVLILAGLAVILSSLWPERWRRKLA